LSQLILIRTSIATETSGRRIECRSVGSETANIASRTTSCRAKCALRTYVAVYASLCGAVGTSSTWNTCCLLGLILVGSTGAQSDIRLTDQRNISTYWGHNACGLPSGALVLSNRTVNACELTNLTLILTKCTRSARASATRGFHETS
jgi:hypothetical protein